MKSKTILIAILALSTFGCAVPAEHQVWYAENSEVQAALIEAVDALCEQTDGAYCPAYTTDPSAATKKVVVKALSTRCGQEKYKGNDFRDALEIQIDLEKVKEGQACQAKVPSDSQKAPYNISVTPPEPLTGAWRLATFSETLAIVIAHELGHTMGLTHIDIPGDLMQSHTGYTCWPGQCETSDHI